MPGNTLHRRWALPAGGLGERSLRLRLDFPSLPAEISSLVMRRESTSRSLGSEIARVLTHSWRHPVEPVTLPESLERYLPLLTSLGVAGLVYRKLDLRNNVGVVNYWSDAFRQFAVEAMLHEHSVVDIFQRARARQVEPILFKGWAIARLYPDVALRPYGDIDLWVRPEEIESLSAALPPDNQYCVEPHATFYRDFERSFDEVMRDSQLVRLGDESIRLPSAEDHLRFVCLHFLHHGGWRPLWLCDVALMIESRPNNFDWDKCLRGSRKYADWVICVIGLANQLLGANISGTPAEKRAQSLPRWISEAALSQWGKGSGMSRAENLSVAFAERPAGPRQVSQALSEHWRNPIQASVEMNAGFNDWPRIAFQIGAAVSRLPEFARSLRANRKRTLAATVPSPASVLRAVSNDPPGTSY